MGRGDGSDPFQHVGDGVADELHAAAEAELGLDVLAVDLHGLDAQVQLGGDVSDGQALADHLVDLDLAVGEGLQGAVVAPVCCGES